LPVVKSRRWAFFFWVALAGGVVDDAVKPFLDAYRPYLPFLSLSVCFVG